MNHRMPRNARPKGIYKLRVGIVAEKMGNQILSPLQNDKIMNSLLYEVWFEIRLMCEPAN